MAEPQEELWRIGERLPRSGSSDVLGLVALFAAFVTLVLLPDMSAVARFVFGAFAALWLTLGVLGSLSQRAHARRDHLNVVAITGFIREAKALRDSGWEPNTTLTLPGFEEWFNVNVIRWFEIHLPDHEVDLHVAATGAPLNGYSGIGGSVLDAVVVIDSELEALRDILRAIRQ